ncbi:MAG: hypothetical protein ABEJ72_05395, partial [Candidatus Aenigmatarchaeota archaeon]
VRLAGGQPVTDVLKAIAGFVGGVAVTLYFILKNPSMILEHMDMKDAVDMMEILQEGGQDERRDKETN